MTFKQTVIIDYQYLLDMWVNRVYRLYRDEFRQINCIQGWMEKTFPRSNILDINIHLLLQLDGHSRRIILENYRIRKLGDNFRQSELKQELMAKMFHPSNLHKFEGWGFGLDD